MDRIFTIIGVILAILYIVLSLAGLGNTFVNLMEPVAIIFVGVGVLTGR